MADAKKIPKARAYEVVVSFSGLDKGDRFTESTDGGQAWAQQFVDTGYLRDATEEVSDAGRGEVGQG